MMRQFYEQIPYLRSPIPKYTVNPYEYAILLPIFYTRKSIEYNELLKQDRANLRIEGFCKRAMWLAYELINLTDIQTHQVGIYVVTTPEVNKMLTPYAEACQFENILVFDIEDYAYLTKIFLLHEASKVLLAERLIMKDLSIFVCGDSSKEPNPFMYRVREEWITEKMGHKCEYIVPFMFDHEQSGTFEKALNRYNPDKITEDAYYEMAADFVGCSVAEYKAFWFGETPRPYIFGSTHAMCRDFVTSKAFADALDPISKLTGCSEVFIELFLHKHFDLIDDRFEGHGEFGFCHHDQWGTYQRLPKNTYHINAGSNEKEFPNIFNKIMNNMHRINKDALQQ